MRISDWSSDVCSSDLAIGVGKRRRVAIIAALTGRPPVRADESGAKHAIVPLYTGAMDNDKAVVGREHLWSITSAFEPGDHHPRLQIADLGGGDFARLPAARPRLRLGSAHAKQGHRDNGSPDVLRSEEHTSELQSLMRNSYAV